MSEVICSRLDDELVEILDDFLKKQPFKVSRSEFIKRAIEEKLNKEFKHEKIKQN